MKPELFRKVMAHLDALALQTMVHAAVGVTGLSERTKQRFQKDAWNNSPQRMRLAEKIRKWPDGDFEKFTASFENFPVEMRKLFKDAAASMPKNRGGRTPHFPLAVRKRAIQELGSEHSRGHTFREALEIVAKRHGMGSDYLHKVWKNRKRLNTSTQDKIT